VSWYGQTETDYSGVQSQCPAQPISLGPDSLALSWLYVTSRIQLQSESIVYQLVALSALQ